MKKAALLCAIGFWSSCITSAACAHTSEPKSPTHKSSKSAVWTAEPESFMGITLGTPIPPSVPLCPKANYSVYPDFSRIHEGDLCITDAIGEVADLWGTPSLGFDYRTSVFRREGRVYSIWLSLDSDSYQKAVSLLVTKYGPPTSTTADTVQTKGGADFENMTTQWKGRKVSIRAIQRFDKVDQSVIMIDDLSMQAEMADEIKSKQNSAASKL